MVWSKELKAKVYAFTATISRLKEGRASAQGHLDGSRRVPPPADLFAGTPSTRNSGRRFLLHVPGCAICHHSLLPLSPQQAANVNLSDEYFYCTHRALVDRFELLLDTDHEARKQSLGLPNFTYASQLHADCGECEHCTAQPCGACNPCRKNRGTCRARVCREGYLVQPHYMEGCGTSVGTSVSVENSLANDLILLRALRESMATAHRELSDFIEVEAPELEGSHPLLTLENLQDKVDTIRTAIATLEQDIGVALEVQDRDNSIDEDLEQALGRAGGLLDSDLPLSAGIGDPGLQRLQPEGDGMLPPADITQETPDAPSGIPFPPPLQVRMMPEQGASPSIRDRVEALHESGLQSRFVSSRLSDTRLYPPLSQATGPPPAASSTTFHLTIPVSSAPPTVSTQTASTTTTASLRTSHTSMAPTAPNPRPPTSSRPPPVPPAFEARQPTGDEVSPDLISAQEEHEGACTHVVRVLDSLAFRASRLGEYRDDVSLALGKDVTRASGLLDQARSSLTKWLRLVRGGEARNLTKSRAMDNLDLLETRLTAIAERTAAYDMGAPLRSRAASNPEIPSPRRRGNLPRFAVPKFSGRLEDFPSFRRRFQALTTGTCYTQDELLEFLREAIPEEKRCKLLGVATVASAWAKLNQWYGNKKDLLLTITTGLKKLALHDMAWYDRVERLSDEIAMAEDRLLDHGGTVALEGDVTMVATLVAKLDTRQRGDWAVFCTEELAGDDTSLSSFTQWLLKQQQTAIREKTNSKWIAAQDSTPHSPLCGSCGLGEHPTIRCPFPPSKVMAVEAVLPQPLQHQVRASSADRARLTWADRERKAGVCPVCGQRHTYRRTLPGKSPFTAPGSFYTDCKHFLELSVADRRNAVMSTNGCMRCMDWNHPTPECPRPTFRCRKQGCGGPHAQAVHPEPNTSSSLIDLTQSSSSAAVLRHEADDPETHYQEESAPAVLCVANPPRLSRHHPSHQEMRGGRGQWPALPRPPRQAPGCVANPPRLSRHHPVMLEVQHVPAGSPDSHSMDPAVVFWDRGSSLSLVTHDWAARAKLPSTPQSISIKVVGQDFQRIETREYRLELLDRKGDRVTIHAMGLPSISSILGPGDVSIIAHLFPEACPTVFQRPQGGVDLLIGLNYRQFMPDGGRFAEGLCLANTPFGTGHIITGAHKDIRGLTGVLSAHALEMRMGVTCEPPCAVVNFVDLRIPVCTPSKLTRVRGGPAKPPGLPDCWPTAAEKPQPPAQRPPQDASPDDAGGCRPQATRSIQVPTPTSPQVGCLATTLPPAPHGIASGDEKGIGVCTVGGVHEVVPGGPGVAKPLAQVTDLCAIPEEGEFWDQDFLARALQGSEEGCAPAPQCLRCKTCEECRFRVQGMTRKEAAVLARVESEMSVCPRTGTITIHYPWNSNAFSLKDNSKQAIARQAAVERRVHRSGRGQDYKAEMRKAFDSGAAVRLTGVEMESWSGPVHYLVHFPVYKPGSGSTPLRIVANSALKNCHNGKSLNECMDRGPNTLTDITQVLIKWRGFEETLLYDLSKAYQSLRVGDLERNLRRFKWRDSPDEAWANYAYDRVTFGDEVASLALESAKKVVARKGAAYDPQAAKLLVEASLVDDGCTGGSNADCRRMKGVRLKDGSYTGTVPKMLGEGGFSVKFMVHAKHCTKEEADSLGGKVLGIEFDAMRDTLHFNFSVRFKLLGRHRSAKPEHEVLDLKELDRITSGSRILTKRQALSFLMGQYDPLGLVSPLMVRGKLLLRRTMQSGRGWDQDLPADLKGSWVAYMKELLSMPTITFPRATKPPGAVSAKLIVFWDGALPAYCVAAYVRWVKQDQTVSVHLVFGKARIAPVRGTSCPRSELQGMLLASRISILVLRSLDHRVEELILMGDSQCCIDATSKPANEMRVFFQNRVSEFHTNLELAGALTTKITGPLHIPGHLNPADTGTRGLATLADVAQGSVWLHGPPFLREPQHNWPVTSQISETMPREELRGTGILRQRLGVGLEQEAGHEQQDILNQIHHLPPQVPERYLLIRQATELISNGYTWDKTVGAMARLLRASVHARMSRILGARLDTENQLLREPSTNDRAIASRLLLQASSEPVLLLLRQGHLASLHAWNCGGVVWTRGRFPTRMLQDKLGLPALPVVKGSSQAAVLILRQAHLQDHNKDPKYVLARAKRVAWLLQGRGTAIKVIDDCSRCRLLAHKTQNQIMGSVPMHLPIRARAFQVTSLDFFGPFLCRGLGAGQRRSAKAWGLIYACLSTKAVAIWAVPAYDSATFLLAHHRHCATYGVPRLVLADHGPNLVARVHGEEFVDWEVIKSDSTGKLTTWNLSAKGCPWRNGLAERAVGLAKRTMQRRLEAHKSMDFFQLEVAFSKVAETLNSRPIAVRAYTEDTFYAICPADLLQGRIAEVGAHHPTTLDLEHLTSPHLMGDQLAQAAEFVSSWWAEWEPLYFDMAMTRPKWKKLQPNLGAGDIVQVRYEDKFGPPTFRLGRVQEVHPDLQGVVRTVTMGLRNRKPREPPEQCQGGLSSITIGVQRVCLLYPADRQLPGAAWALDQPPGSNQAAQPLPTLEDLPEAQQQEDNEDDLRRALLQSSSSPQHTEPVTQSVPSPPQDTEPVTQSVPSSLQDTEPVTQSAPSSSPDTEPLTQSTPATTPGAAPRRSARLRGQPAPIMAITWEGHSNFTATGVTTHDVCALLSECSNQAYRAVPWLAISPLQVESGPDTAGAQREHTTPGPERLDQARPPNHLAPAAPEPPHHEVVWSLQRERDEQESACSSKNCSSTPTNYSVL